MTCVCVTGFILLWHMFVLQGPCDYDLCLYNRVHMTMTCVCVTGFSWLWRVFVLQGSYDYDVCFSYRVHMTITSVCVTGFIWLWRVFVLQGLEIVNPQAAERKVQAANAKYFSSTAGFHKLKKEDTWSAHQRPLSPDIALFWMCEILEDHGSQATAWRHCCESRSFII